MFRIFPLRGFNILKINTANIKFSITPEIINQLMDAPVIHSVLLHGGVHAREREASMFDGNFTTTYYKIIFLRRQAQHL
jgi:hypothetical protein